MNVEKELLELLRKFKIVIEDVRESTKLGKDTKLSKFRIGLFSHTVNQYAKAAEEEVKGLTGEKAMSDKELLLKHLNKPRGPSPQMMPMVQPKG